MQHPAIGDFVAVRPEVLTDTAHVLRAAAKQFYTTERAVAEHIVAYMVPTYLLALAQDTRDVPPTPHVRVSRDKLRDMADALERAMDYLHRRWAGEWCEVTRGSGECVLLIEDLIPEYLDALSLRVERS